MLSLKHVASRTRVRSSPFQYVIQSIFSSSTVPVLFSNRIQSSSSSTTTIEGISRIQSKEVASSFKDWFMSRNDSLLDQIYSILGTHDDFNDDFSLTSPRSGDLALSRLGLRLTESFVLEVLNYGSVILSCLKFFDWAGRQPGFQHTRATFHAIFKILSRSKLTSLMLDFLEDYMKHRYVHRVRFYDTLVMGYAVAGKPEVALLLFGKMRFQGLDLDSFAYHILLNALVEERCFEAVDEIAEQIRMRGYENVITHSIVVKCFCKQKLLEEGEAYLRNLVKNGGVLSGHALSGHALSVLVDAFCKNDEFERAAMLVEEFRELGTVPMEQSYNVWIRELVQADKLDGAMEFLRSKKLEEGYIPDVFRYNMLIFRLLKENRLEEVLDLLMEMKEGQISPDSVTMNATLCFFCKAGMVDVAVDLYYAGGEYGFSPNSMAYNYLINTLCGDGSVDEAYRVLENSIGHGYFPGEKTFSILAQSLCREGKIDKANELFLVAFKHNFVPSGLTYDMFISALCENERVEDGYRIHGHLNRLNKVTAKKTYYNLIHGFNKSNRGDFSARLLIEMQEKGHKPTSNLFKAVIGSLFEMDNPEIQFYKLLEMQLSRREPNCEIYNIFICGAGHAKKPDLAREVFEMMGRSGVVPNLNSDILVLRSYLKSGRFSDALNFFTQLRDRRKIGRKLYNTMVVGLSKARKSDIALDFLREMRVNGVLPSIECYEELILALCSNEQYDLVVNLVEDFEKCGRNLSSFIGNVLLFNSLKTQELHKSWVRLKEVQDDKPSSLMLGQLIGAFSSLIVNDRIEELENLIESCFPLDIYTCNMLLRRLCRNEINFACEYFNRLCRKGYEPNRYTYDILAHGLFKHGRTAEAMRCIEEMFRKGFHPTERTELFM